MQRRNFLIGAAGTAIGGSALVGSGAFTSVEAERSVTVEVAGDANAFLGLSAGADGGRIVNNVDVGAQDGEIVELDFGDIDGANGDGINKNATTRFDDVLNVANQGSQTVYIWFPNPQDDRSDRSRILTQSGTDITQPQNSLELSSGTDEDLSFEFETGEASRIGEFDKDLVILAEADQPTEDSDWNETIDVEYTAPPE